MRWGECTSTRIGRLELDGRVGLVPVGATEQHGPHLPTDTDTRIAQAICDAAAASCAATIVLPPVSIGCSLGHGTAFPGTLSLFPEELARLLIRIAEWSALSGLRKLIFVNAHMGNVAALGMATDRLRFVRPDLRSTWVDWWDATPAITAEVMADGADIHANRAETSLALHLFPELVDRPAMLDADDPDRTGALIFRYTAEVLSGNGVTGEPSRATASLGNSLFDAVVEVVVHKVLAGVSEEPPLPRTLHPPRALRFEEATDGHR
ncbi:creatininase family protein [Mycobacterium sherrisii]|uniref:Creatininase n=2 Tax=Mycobacterium sherrisii TaxID=243061 RepID=A0A1E3SPT4_9MYCO|nr:creatininase family protein [Mycobacterium sherrisii]MCV7032399.1 creatininase family protein [Mycobacterium sherrisii]ODR04150.1 creatininase [Mycobacterium sherrisii]ORW75937.1 creatininase [Mycobacterium sherrisii]